MQNMKNGHKMFLVAQKKCPDALNATQKTPAFYKVGFLKKSRKLSFLAVLVKNGYFMMFFLIFSETVLCKGLGFFVLHSVRQDASFELSKTSFGIFSPIFHYKWDSFDLGGVKT